MAEIYTVSLLAAWVVKMESKPSDRKNQVKLIMAESLLIVAVIRFLIASLGVALDAVPHPQEINWGWVNISASPQKFVTSFYVEAGEQGRRLFFWHPGEFLEISPMKNVGKNNVHRW